MFERARVDNTSRTPVPCVLVLDDGRELTGHLMVTATRGILEELNAAGGFAEFEGLNRERSFLAKSSIRSASSVAAAAKVEPLSNRVREGVVFDPYTVLGIDRGADRETIRRAYHTLAKSYHPDRMLAADLPAEMVDYATAMAKRINAAYSALAGMMASQDEAPAAQRRQAAGQGR